MKLRLEIEVAQNENGRWVASGPLELVDYGNTREHAIGEWLSTFTDLWIEFCEVDPSTLAPDAVRLRDGLMRLVFP